MNPTLLDDRAPTGHAPFSQLQQTIFLFNL